MTSTAAVPVRTALEPGTVRIAVASTFFLNGAVAGMWAALIPVIKERFSLDDSALGIVLLIGMLGAIGGMIGGSRLATRTGTRSVIVAFGIFALAALSGPLLAASWLGLVGAVLILFLGMGATDVVMNGHAALVENRIGRPVMSGFHGWWSLGGFVGAGVAAPAIGGLGPLVPTLALAIVGAGVMVFFVLPRLYPSAEDRSAGNAPMFGRPGPRTLLLGVIAMIALVSEGAAIDWAAVWLRQDLGASLRLAPIAFATFALGMCIGRFSGDRIRERVATTRLLVGAALLWSTGLALAITLGTLTAEPLAALPGFFLFGLGNSVVFPVLLALAAEKTRRSAAEAIAGVATFGYLGLMVGPPMIGFLAEAYGLTATLLSVVVLGLLAAALARRA